MTNSRGDLMLKKSLRIIGFIIGIFTFLLILQFNVSVEKETPRIIRLVLNG